MAVEDDHNGHFVKEDVSSNRQRVTEGTVPVSLTKLEDDLAYCSEKLLNLQTLMTQVAGRSIDFDSLNWEDEETLTAYVETAFELDLMSGISRLEVKELQNFIVFIRNEIENNGHSYPCVDNLEEFNVKIINKLNDAADSAKKVHNLVSYVRKRLVTFERNFGFFTSDAWYDEVEEFGNGNGHMLSANTNRALLMTDQQGHVLQQLDKSLARELDHEKMLSDSRSNAEDLKLKLPLVETELCNSEESVNLYMGRLFEAENTAELFLGISRELMGKLDAIQINMSNSILCDQDARSQLQESMETYNHIQGLLSAKEAGLKERLKDANDQNIYSEYEFSYLKEKAMALEEEIMESDIQLLLANASVKSSQEQHGTLCLEITRMENLIECMKADLLRTESTAERFERKCMELNRTNSALIKELDVLKNSEVENTSALMERRLNELEAQLENEQATVKANEEHQNLLYATIDDMESTIKELKGKVSKAEARADNAESKCISLTDTKIELSEELGFLRGQVESLEASLQLAEDTKRSNAKEICAHTKNITNLIKNLASERESLQLQVSALSKKRKLFCEKSMRKGDAHKLSSGKGPDILTDLDFLKSPEEAFDQSSTTDVQVDMSASAVVANKMEFERIASSEDCKDADLDIETVRTIEVAQLDWTHLLMVILVLSVSILTMYMYRIEDRLE